MDQDKDADKDENANSKEATARMEAFRINMEATERLKKIMEDAGLPHDGPTPAVTAILAAVRGQARALVDLAVWRIEQSDMIGHSISHDEAMFFLTAIEAIAGEVRRITNERRV